MLSLLLAHAAFAAPCDDISGGDIAWDGLHHDTFHTDWRAPGGARPAGDDVRLVLRACQGDLTAARLRIWNGRTHTETWVELSPETTGVDPVLGPVDLWETTLALPDDPAVLYYFFEVEDGPEAKVWFVDDDPIFLGGGYGATIAEWDDSRSFQITVYDPALTAPEWAEGGVVYQIFPDRFRNGDPSNDPIDGAGFSYGHTDVLLPWDAPLEGRCVGADQERAACYTGGDLVGIIEQLDMLDELGVDMLYLNPIFRSATNHRYDTLDYRAIDDELGTLDDFTALVEAARERDISLVLDGVFNHVSADSVYFDLYGRWDDDGQLVSPDSAGDWDGSGACESPDSPYRDWFTFPAEHAPGRTEEGETVLCADGLGDRTSSYESWGTYFHIPKLAADRQSVRDLIYATPDSAALYWLDAGARGWRLDVSGEVDPGRGHNIDNDFWEGFFDAVTATDPDALIVGEVWHDASPWMVGGEWHATMNYRLRAAVLDWLFDACVAGPGCPDGTWFEDNDSADWRESGRVDPIDDPTLKLRLQSILEDTPEPLWHVQMNLLGSHDVSRLGWMLRMGSSGDSALALDKQRLAALLVYTWPGMPTVYYGDEVDLSPDSQWDGGIYQDDPYNRATYPWEDLGGAPDTHLRDWYAGLAEMRKDSPALMRGGVRFLEAEGVVAFVREADDDVAQVVLNRSEAVVDTALEVDGVWEDVLSGRRFEARDGVLSVDDVPALSGVVLRSTDAGPGGDTGEGDSVEDAVPASEASKDDGCGCVSGSASGGLLLGVLGLVARRRVGSAGAPSACSAGTSP